MSETAETRSMPLPEDTIVTITRELTEEEHQWSHFPSHSPGRDPRYTVQEFFAASSEDGEPDVDIYEGIDEHGCSVQLPASAVEVVMTAAAADARKVPAPRDVARAFSSSSLTDHDRYGFEIDEASAIGATFEVYGRTHEGLRFAAHVVVKSVWETDL